MLGIFFVYLKPFSSISWIKEKFNEQKKKKNKRVGRHSSTNDKSFTTTLRNENISLVKEFFHLTTYVGVICLLIFLDDKIEERRMFAI